MRKSRVLAKLRADKPVFGVGVNLGPSIIASGLVGTVGYDFTFIDMEHRWIGYTEAAMMALATREGGADPMIRIADTANHSAFHRCFEIGATGVLMPHAKTGADARKAVNYSKFYPVGQRGMDPVNIDADFGMGGSLMEIIEWHNRETFVALQIEDREAIDNIDAIASVPGVDILFVGPVDLSQSYGEPGLFDAPELQTAVDKVAKASEKHGKWWGVPAMDNPDKVRQYMGMGARFFTVLSDYHALKSTMIRQKDAFKELMSSV